MKQARPRTIVGVVLAFLATACSATASQPAGQGGGGAGADNGAGASGAGGSVFAVGSSGAGVGGGGDGCSDETKASIYILGQNKEFARFEPQTQKLTVLGSLACPGEEFSSTFSMAVDRQGVAWVLFIDGRIFQVNTKTVACTATAFTACQSSFCQFGMGFVADAAGSDEETLYVSGVYNTPPGVGLAKVDANTLLLTPIADYDTLAGKGAELTGTGDARLFGYFQDNPIRLAEIDKATAHIITSSDLLQIPTGTSWAFAFWGGSFYIMSGTAIRKYEPTAQLTTVINGNVGFDIVGAGVSTCAPLEPPS